MRAFTATPAQEQAWQKYTADSAHPPDPEHDRVRACRSHRCGLPVWDGTTAAKGVPCAFDVKPDGTLTRTSHWRTCLDRPAFARKKR